ncbi:MAG: hypothetical protein IKR82_02085 [Bacteroidales bacterium]|nr:hypothetical protein [Bacteroidales bacterium]
MAISNDSKVLLGFNNSQDVINLQTKYTLFKRVVNIVFSVTCDEGYDPQLMTQALNKLFERNDCLRITFVKEGKQVKQFFAEHRTVGLIPTLKFDTYGKMEAFINRFRRKPTNAYKGDVLRVVYAVNPEGKQMIFFKISHFVADTYGIGILVNDLFAVYNALRDGQELPPAPGSFFEIIRKDNEYRTSEALKKDEEFFHDYIFNRHPEHPYYCGTHGNKSDRWMKEKLKGNFAKTYLFVRCDTIGYQFTIPASINERALKWCEANAISLSSFYYYTCSIAQSLINDRCEKVLNLELLNCRGTVADRKAAGTKAQSIVIYTPVDYAKSFIDNIKPVYDEQQEIYRHTRMSYLDIEAMQHKAWNYSMLRSVNGVAFSFIPLAAPKGIRLEVHSNGKGALFTYMALIHDINTNEVYVNYDVQKLMVTAQQLIDFQNQYIRVIEGVLARPDAALEEVFPA